MDPEGRAGREGFWSCSRELSGDPWEGSLNSWLEHRFGLWGVTLTGNGLCGVCTSQDGAGRVRVRVQSGLSGGAARVWVGSQDGPSHGGCIYPSQQICRVGVSTPFPDEGAEAQSS